MVDGSRHGYWGEARPGRQDGNPRLRQRRRTITPSHDFPAPAFRQRGEPIPPHTSHPTNPSRSHRPGQGQHYRVASLNLLAAILIYWNTLQLGHAVFARRKDGLVIPTEFLAQVSPLGWERINLTGESRWASTSSAGRAKRLP